MTNSKKNHSNNSKIREGFFSRLERRIFRVLRQVKKEFRLLRTDRPDAW